MGNRCAPPSGRRRSVGPPSRHRATTVAGGIRIPQRTCGRTVGVGQCETTISDVMILPAGGVGLLQHYDRALPEVYGYLIVRCADRALAEDLTSATFLAQSPRQQAHR